MSYFTETALVLLLSTISFFLLNWTGSKLSDYRTITLVSTADDQPGFNFIFRILSPNVLVIIYSAIAYRFDLDAFVPKLWLIVPLQFIIRILFNLERLRLFRWSIFLPTAAAASLISFSLTELGLRQRSTLLPDIANLGNELWVLIFLYLYSALNAFLAQSSHLAKDKKRAYVEHRYAYLTKKFGTYISSLNLSSELNRLMYSVMIVESFNRPGIFRAAERRLVAVLRRPVSQGIMQVSSSTVLSDQQSINLASEILKTSYERVLTKTIEANPDYSKSTDEWKMNFLKSRVLERTIWFYNNSDDYVADVKAVNDLIAEIESEKSSVKLSKEELFAIRLDAFDGAVE